MHWPNIYKILFLMVLYSLLMPVTGVPAGFLIASALIGPYVTGNAVSDLLFGLAAAGAFYYCLQRSLYYRRVWLNAFKRK